MESTRTRAPPGGTFGSVLQVEVVYIPFALDFSESVFSGKCES